MSIFEKNTYVFSDIQALIDSKAEESINLDFKSSESLGRNDGKKKEISKDVSAFANSDGGIIIYGIKEENHIASQPTFIDGNEFTKEWLEQVINSTIQKHIPSIEIFPIRRDGNIRESIYLVKIPKSDLAPHICIDKRFYKRFNFESIAMEEYEVRQLYERKKNSILSLYSIGIKDYTEDSEGNYSIQCSVVIKNDGNVPESTYKTCIYFENLSPRTSVDYDSSNHYYEYTWVNHDTVKLSAQGSQPIFPGEQLTGMRFLINIPKRDFHRMAEDLSFNTILYYSNSMHENNTGLKQALLEFRDKVVNKTAPI